MKCSDLIVELLETQGVKTVFGYPGGNVTHLLESIHKKGTIRYVQGYHEQGCSFAAVGYAKSSEKIGVAISSSGPGATNMITGIADAFYDSAACLFLTGQVSTSGLKKSDNLRQNSFQETDISAIVKPITKYAVCVTEPSEIIYCMEKALFHAQNGRKGPVLLELPHNVQAADVNPAALRHFTPPICERNCLNEPLILQAAALLQQSKQPLVLAGAGLSGPAAKEVRMFCKRRQIPIISSLMALDLFDRDDEGFLGFVGPCGHPRAKYALRNCDLLLALGVRLEGQRAGEMNELTDKAAVIHVDIDEAELANYSRSACLLKLDVQDFIQKIESQLQELGNSANGKWLRRLNHLEDCFEPALRDGDNGIMDPCRFLTQLSEQLGGNAIVCADVGQNLLWAAQSLRLREGARFLASGGLGAMGFSLPASIGAYFARPDATVVSIAGDGGIQMNLQELQTVAKYQIPVKIFILNNHSLGMVRAYQEQWFSGRLGTVEEYLPIPSFEKLADAFGLPYFRITNDQDNCIESVFQTAGPAVAEILLSSHSVVQQGSIKERKHNEVGKD